MSKRGSLSADGIGPILRAARIEQGLATEEIAWRLKVRPDLIRTLERRDPTALAQPALVRSHLGSYARILNLDEGSILEIFDAEAELAAPIEELQAQARAERRPPRARWIVAAAFSALALGTAGVAGFLGTETEPTPALEAPLDATAAEVVDPAAATIRVGVLARRDSRLSITADGLQVFDGTLLAGVQRLFNARDELDIVAADGEGLDISVNGRPVDSRGTGVFSVTFGPGGKRR
jgi:hypothetical protein